MSDGRELHLVVPTVGRASAAEVIGRALVGEIGLARVTVVSQACPPVVTESLLAVAGERGVVLEEVRLDERVGAARARVVGAAAGAGGEEFVGFLDDDIEVDQGTLSDLVFLCRERGLGGACGVVTNSVDNTLPYRVLKAVFFRSIFHDPRSAAVGARGMVPTPVLSGGVTVFRRSVFDACAGGMDDFPADYSWGEDFELSYLASRVSVLAIDPGVRVRNQALGMSRVPADRDDTARRRIERYRAFADRHAHSRREWMSYLAVVVALSGMGVRQRVGGAVRRRLASEARYALRQSFRGANRAPGASGPPRTAGVAAVIPYFRSGRTVVAAVESLVGQSIPPASVTVVANSPVPADVAADLADLGATVVTAGANVGFGAACNLGAAATTSGYVWFVNPDVRCDKDCLEILVDHAGPARAVAPVLRLPDGRVERSAKSASYLRPAVLLSRELGVGRALHLGSPSPGRRVAAVSGACLLVPRAAFERVGGFAEEFFLYGEDVDLCLRLGRAGCGVAVIPGAGAVHASGTGSGDPADPAVQAIKGREARRAHVLLLRRHRSDRAANRYLAGLPWVLRARRLARRGLRTDTAESTDAAAAEWLAGDQA